MQIIYPIVFFIISLKWGKWKNWKRYYPTMLFMVVGNLLYSILFKDYPMWRFEHTFEEKLLPTRMSIDILKSFTSFPILTLIYLSNFPEERKTIKKILYIAFWTIIFFFIEFISKVLGMITYHNGWSIWWSLLFDLAMFSLLVIHYKRPILAMILSGIFSFCLWKVFGINFDLLEK